MVRFTELIALFVSGFTAFAVVGHKRAKVSLTETRTDVVAAAVIAAFGNTHAFLAGKNALGNQLFTDFVNDGFAFVLPNFAKAHEKVFILPPDV